MANAWLEPQFTDTAPLGEMAPFAPADAVIVSMSIAKLAAIVWLAVTLVNVWAVTGPTETPSTRTSAT